jgi:hypothetical protein
MGEQRHLKAPFGGSKTDHALAFFPQPFCIGRVDAQRIHSTGSRVLEEHSCMQLSFATQIKLYMGGTSAQVTALLFLGGNDTMHSGRRALWDSLVETTAQLQPDNEVCDARKQQEESKAPCTAENL